MDLELQVGWLLLLHRSLLQLRADEGAQESTAREAGPVLTEGALLFQLLLLDCALIRLGRKEAGPDNLGGGPQGSCLLQTLLHLALLSPRSGIHH